MAVLEMLESIRAPFPDRVMLLVTELGGETFLIVLGLIVLWCVDKRLGRYLLTAGTLGVALSQWLKVLCRVPRPWIRWEGLTIVEAARAGAGGYSFPSGHSQSAAAVFGCIARWYKNRTVRILCAVLTALVMFSRMYLGVHTLSDVTAGCALSLALVFTVYPFFAKGEAGKTRGLLMACLGVCAAYTLFISLYPFPADVDPENLEEGTRSAWILLGASLGITLAYGIDRRFVNYDPRAVWYVQCLKCVLGLGLVMLLRGVLKQPLLSLFRGHPAAEGARYCLMCLTAAGLWPLAFPYLNRLGAQKDGLKGKGERNRV